eukprot:1857860-Rhodomonas_salina.1
MSGAARREKKETAKKKLVGMPSLSGFGRTHHNILHVPVCPRRVPHPASPTRGNHRASAGPREQEAERRTSCMSASKSGRKEPSQVHCSSASFSSSTSQSRTSARRICSNVLHTPTPPSLSLLDRSSFPHDARAETSAVASRKVAAGNCTRRRWSCSCGATSHTCPAPPPPSPARSPLASAGTRPLPPRGPPATALRLSPSGLLLPPVFCGARCLRREGPGYLVGGAEGGGRPAVSVLARLDMADAIEDRERPPPLRPFKPLVQRPVVAQPPAHTPPHTHRERARHTLPFSIQPPTLSAKLRRDWARDGDGGRGADEGAFLDLRGEPGAAVEISVLVVGVRVVCVRRRAALPHEVPRSEPPPPRPLRLLVQLIHLRGAQSTRPFPEVDDVFGQVSPERRAIGALAVGRKGLWRWGDGGGEMARAVVGRYEVER